MGRRLVGAGMSRPTPGGSRVTYLEFKRAGIAPIQLSCDSTLATKSFVHECTKPAGHEDAHRADSGVWWSR